ncbi:MAG TPA: type III pantothenate kinase [Gammaproteobacteria bacterium]|nr:type III pantothenate kinase [Gammaproteobacteria bacterium]
MKLQRGGDSAASASDERPPSPGSEPAATVVVDIGNARIKWACVEGGRLFAAGHAVHAGALDSALEAFAAALPASAGRIVAANVAGEDVASRLAALMLARRGLEPFFVRTAAETLGVRCGYRDPSRLGVDRWVALVAAHKLAAVPGGEPHPACVINAGTAITFDAVDAAGQHLGGLILAGPRIVADALDRNTRGIGATLPADGVPAGLELLGRSTDEAVGRGALLAPAAAFDRVIRIIESALGASPRVFLAGGDAPLLAPWLETKVQLRADLVLEGLALLAEGAPAEPRQPGERAAASAIPERSRR